MTSLDLELARYLDARLAEVIAQQTHKIVMGIAPDYAAYRETVGEIRAYQTARLMLKETMEGLLQGPTDKQRQMT